MMEQTLEVYFLGGGREGFVALMNKILVGVPSPADPEEMCPDDYSFVAGIG